MSTLQYRIWRDGYLWHWEVLTDGGLRLRRGASDDMVKTRAEGMLAATHPAIHIEIDTIALSRSAELLEIAVRARAVAREWRETLEQDLPKLRNSCIVSEKMARTSRAALIGSRLMLRRLSGHSNLKRSQ